jgi:cytoskeletal protein CcmA (bactofilin family)
MALFGEKKAKKVKEAPSIIKSDKISSATIITSCMQITGNLDGTDTIHIDGHVKGDITVSNTVVIGKSGVVEGHIEAKHVIINGELNGSIRCENLEVMRTGKVSKNIEANILILDGTIDGEILASDNIKVLENANIHATKLKSKNITVNGKVKGVVIASGLLAIGSKGFVEGQITVKNIKTEEGGRMIGTMATYEDESKKSKPVHREPKKEIKAEKTVTPTQSKTEKEDDFFSKK